MDFIEDALSYFEPIQWYIFATFVFAMVSFIPKNPVYRILFLILLVNSITEMISVVLALHHIRLGFLFSVSLIFHNGLWLWLLYKAVKQRLLFKLLFIGYLGFAVLNLICWEGSSRFNINTFIIGAFLYLTVFIYESFFQLKQENFPYFLSNYYLLLLAPVLFFVGLSFVLGFKSRALTRTIIYGNVHLYEFIVCFINIIYYSLINIYIYREKKVGNAQ